MRIHDHIVVEQHDDFMLRFTDTCVVPQRESDVFGQRNHANLRIGRPEIFDGTIRAAIVHDQNLVGPAIERHRLNNGWDALR